MDAIRRFYCPRLHDIIDDLITNYDVINYADLIFIIAGKDKKTML